MDDELEKILESVLFSYGEGLTLEKMSHGLGIHMALVQSSIDKLSQKYISENSGVQIVNINGTYQMSTNPKYHTYIKKISNVRIQNLSKVQLETLSIIAYKQPITKSEIEQIRGVDCTSPINKLLEYNLIEEKGRKKSPGRPILFVTTDDFLRHFGISDIKDLPKIY